jgi:hypothetical protein
MSIYDEYTRNRDKYASGKEANNASYSDYLINKYSHRIAANKTASTLDPSAYDQNYEGQYKSVFKSKTPTTSTSYSSPSYPSRVTGVTPTSSQRLSAAYSPVSKSYTSTSKQI